MEQALGAVAQSAKAALGTVAQRAKVACRRRSLAVQSAKEGSMAKTGRNELCSCGSGKKFKKCHGIKTESQRQSKFLMIVVGGAVVAALAAVVAQVTTERRPGADRVWDPAHGHYHVNGQHAP
jgi:hypothetical protein